MNPDITEALEGWEFEPGSITVRKILGEDGRPKLQMRLELGMIQMEMTGRPDGQRPHERESYLHYYQEKLVEHVRKRGSKEGFRLSSDAAEHLRSEALHYYYRYLSLFHLQDYEQVVLDTARNLEAAEFLKSFGRTEKDRVSVDQYRAYILMMNTQARARLARQASQPFEAIGLIRSGIRAIRSWLQSNLDEEATKKGGEISLLEGLEKEILGEMPERPLDQVEAELRLAVERQEFEKAACLRDYLRRQAKTQGG
ncbi:MAG: UvrB/UvrC motif-containing protein [Planctomycetes bacterium]|nr:UvrB/UvrC motif-containing protein [Planctomycetota bacterium]